MTLHAYVLCGYATTGCSFEDLPDAREDRVEWQKRVREIRAVWNDDDDDDEEVTTQKM